MMTALSFSFKKTTSFPDTFFKMSTFGHVGGLKWGKENFS